VYSVIVTKDCELIAEIIFSPDDCRLKKGGNEGASNWQNRYKACDVGECKEVMAVRRQIFPDLTSRQFSSFYHFLCIPPLRCTVHEWLEHSPPVLNVAVSEHSLRSCTGFFKNSLCSPSTK